MCKISLSININSISYISISEDPIIVVQYKLCIPSTDDLSVKICVKHSHYLLLVPIIFLR